MVDHKALASKWQGKWDNSNLHSANMDNSKDKFFITTPYPYISGSLHIGHGRSVVETDIIARFKRLEGYNVLFPLGFHITGTPVLGISSAIENNDKKMISLYRRYVSAYVDDEKEIDEILDSFKNPQAIVDFFIPKMIKEYSSLGASIDWRRSFTSGDVIHQKLVEWQFKKFNDLGYIRQADYPVLYCPKDGNAMGEDDIKDADSNPVEKQEFTLLKFHLEDQKFLVAGTLRPETVFGQTNLWVDPDASYVDVKVKEETWVMSEDAAKKYHFQNKNIVISKSFSGEKLIGLFVKAPFKDEKIPVLPGSFVKPDRVTGIVTSVPSDAPYDLQALFDLKSDFVIQKKYSIKDVVQKVEVIPIIATKRYGDVAANSVLSNAGIKDQFDERLDDLTKEVYREGFHNGKLTSACKDYEGLRVKEAKVKIKDDLMKAGLADVIFETSRPAFSRSGADIVVAMLSGQWFIDFNAGSWKEEAKKVLENTALLPDSYRKEFHAAFDWLDKRPCARRRGLGTQFPMDKEWIIESLSDSTLYMNLYAFSHLVKDHSLTENNLCFEFFEFLFSDLDIEKARAASQISKDTLLSIKKSWDYWSPCDQRHTYELHLSNHLSFMMFAHAAALKDKHPRSISFHGMVMSEGTKMSKSKGNVISLLDIKKNYGADVFRFYLVNASMLTGAFDWSEKEAKAAQKNLDRVYDLALEIIECTKEFDSSVERNDLKGIDFFLSSFNRVLSKAKDFMKVNNLRDYSTAVYYEIPSLIKKAKLDLDSFGFSYFGDYVSSKWVIALNPVTPHMSEDLWSKLPKSEDCKYSSNASFPQIDFDLINDKVEFLEKIYEDVMEDITQIKELTGIENPKKVRILIAKKWKYDFVKEFKQKFKEEKAVNNLVKYFMASDFKKHGKEVISLINMFCKSPSRLPEVDLSLNTELDFLARRFAGVKFSVELADEVNESKGNKALPAKPALLIE